MLYIIALKENNSVYLKIQCFKIHCKLKCSESKNDSELPARNNTVISRTLCIKD